MSHLIRDAFLTYLPPFFFQADFACCFNDYLSVGLHTSWPSEEVESIMERTKMTALVASLAEAQKLVRRRKLPAFLRVIILMDQEDDEACTSLRLAFGGKGRAVVTIVSLMAAAARRGNSFASLTGAGSEIPADFGLGMTITEKIEDEAADEDVFTLSKLFVSQSLTKQAQDTLLNSH